METIFHSLQFTPAFLRNKNGRARNSYKSLSVTFPTNAVALNFENIKESKKKTQKTCADSEI